jgi:hypothetical protein
VGPEREIPQLRVREQAHDDRVSVNHRVAGIGDRSRARLATLIANFGAAGESSNFVSSTHKAANHWQAHLAGANEPDTGTGTHHRSTSSDGGT